MSYISYRLMITTDSWSSRDTAEVHVYIKNFNVTLTNHVSDGKDPIIIFDFLICFINEADMLNISVAQAFILLPTLLADPAETHFGTNLGGTSCHNGMNRCRKVMDYLYCVRRQPLPPCVKSSRIFSASSRRRMKMKKSIGSACIRPYSDLATNISKKRR